jgi:hypothetical protein
MIGVIFNYLSEIVEVRVDGTNVFFRTSQSPIFATIEGLRIEKSGVIKEFPDLKDNPEWKNIAIERFKEKIKSYNTEMERVKYIIEDLNKYGYVPLYYQRQGHRPVKLNKN